MLPLQTDRSRPISTALPLNRKQCPWRTLSTGRRCPFLHYRNIMKHAHKVYTWLTERSSSCWLLLRIADTDNSILKKWVCGRWLTGIAGSNPPGDMESCLLCVLCFARYFSLRRPIPRTEESYRVCLYVCVCVCVCVCVVCYQVQ